MQSRRAPVFYSLDKAGEYIRKSGAKRLVLANGCFDLLHVGHIRYLRGARELGDFLLVALNDDRSSKQIKGKGRPVLGEQERAHILSGLEAVDAVLVFSTVDVVPVLEFLRPYCHAKGTDYSIDTVPEIETSRRLGVKCAIVGDPKDHATSSLLQRLREGFEAQEKDE